MRNKFSVAEAIAWKCPGKFVTRPGAQADILRSRREKSVAVAWRSRTKLGLVTGYAQDYSYALTPEIYLEPYVYCSTSRRPIRETKKAITILFIFATENARIIVIIQKANANLIAFLA